MENIKVGPGVLCEVVNGLEGKNSPNLGMFVRVTRFIGNYETYGPVWEAKNEYGERPSYSRIHRPIAPGHQDYLESWLRPIPPEKDPLKALNIQQPETV